MRLARLLATENLTLEYSDDTQSSFDPVERILSIPNWATKDMYVHDVLLCNEVAHALYTPIEFNEDYAGKETKHVQIFNIIEDYRVYKEICKRFPGMVHTFRNGYKSIAVDNDYFGLSKVDVDTLSLADRINIHLKAGEFIDIPFTEKERELLKTIMSVKTYEESKTMAFVLNDLTKFGSKSVFYPDSKYLDINYCTSQLKYSSYNNPKAISVMSSPPSFPLSTNPNPGSGDMRYETSVVIDESYEAVPPVVNTFDDKWSEPIFVEEPEEDTDFLNSNDSVFTQDNLKNSISNLVQNNRKQGTKYLRLTDTTRLKASDYVVPYKQVLSDLDHLMGGFDTESSPGKAWEEFKTKNKLLVSNMIRVFESNKSAHLYRRALIDNTGVLDTNKVYNYLVSEDIFKRNIILPEDKNHGMIFLLDWSGSMSSVIYSVVKQLIQLVSFCKKRNIPFVVYGMAICPQLKTKNKDRLNYSPYQIAEDYRVEMMQEEKQITNTGIIRPRKSLTLIEFFNSKMTHSEFNRQLRNLFILSTTYTGTPYNLSSTPLNDSLVLAHSMIREFQAKHRVEKLNVITLTDGCSDIVLDPYARGTYCLQDYSNYKSYEFSSPNKLTEALVKNLRDTFKSVKFICFDISSSLRSSYWNQDCTNSKDVMAEIKKNKFCEYKNSFYDYMLIIDPSVFYNVVLKEPEKCTTRAQIKNFYMKKSIKDNENKKLLTEFVKYIS